MAQFPALPFFTDAFIGDTQHLSAEEVGVYLLLLFTAWRRPGCDLPDDDRFLAHVARCDIRTWKQRLRPVMAEFHTIAEGKWTQKRLMKVRFYVDHRSETMRGLAKRRWAKNNGMAGADAYANADAGAYASKSKSIRRREIFSKENLSPSDGESSASSANGSGGVPRPLVSTGNADESKRVTAEDFKRGEIGNLVRISPGVWRKKEADDDGET